MNIKRTDLIRFYDERTNTEGRGGDVSAITALWGEDLLISLLQHYWKSRENANSKILSYTCTTGRQKGPRLDAWVLKNPLKATAELYQVEVKNWTAYSFGGKSLRHDLTGDTQELLACSNQHWSHFFSRTSLPKEIAKVIEPMQPPAGYSDHKPRPLLCFWAYILNSKNQPLGQWTSGNNRTLSIFSASAYLRSLTDETLDLNMPRAERRLELLNSLQGIK
jgi:hypothetical protein